MVGAILPHGRQSNEKRKETRAELGRFDLLCLAPYIGCSSRGVRYT